MKRYWYRTKQAVRFWWQRRTRGWDDSDLWNLDVTAADWLAPRIARFRVVTHTHPCDLTPEEWDAKLALMQRAFEWVADEDGAFGPQPDFVDEGLRAFVAYFQGLWD